MQIDKLAITTIPRSSWQSFDLGCQMALRWYGSLIGFWLLASLPIFVLLYGLFGFWGLMATWLFKPWFERGLLYIFSRRVFGEDVGAFDALKALPSQLSNMWLASITWLRLSPTRGFDLAVVQLEGLSKERRSKRLSSLHRSKDDNTTWWLLICVHWEGFLYFAGALLLYFFIPPGIDLGIQDIIANWIDGWIGDLLIFLCWAIVAPFYVGGSFAAYLNRRIQLEGWDIELNFKKMRQSRPSNGVARCFIAAMLLGLLSFKPIPSAHAQQTSHNTDGQQSALQSSDETAEPTGKLESQQRIETILDNPPFSEETTETRFRWVSDKSEEQQEPDSLPDWLLPLIKFIASISELLLWGLFVSVLGLLLYLSRHHIMALFNINWSKAPSIQQPEPQFIPTFSYDYAQEALPDDIPGELQGLLERRQYRAQLSLMLIASLMQISRHQAIAINKSMTEKECLAVIKQTLSGEQGDFMGRLIDTWVNLAWGHVTPGHEHMVQLNLAWQDMFGARQEEP